MKVLLLDNVDKLGVVGDVVEVRRGYAVNYLMPRNLAVIAKENLIRAHQAQVESALAKMEEQKEKLLVVIESIDGKEYKLEKNVNKDQKMFGSISKKDVQELLSEVDLDWDLIELDLSKIKKDIAKYPVYLKMPFSLRAQITINVQEKK